MSVTLATLITLMRTARLDDNALPYKWSDAALSHVINEAQKEATRRAHLIIDKTTDTYCKVPLLVGISSYTLNEKVLQVREAYIGPYLKGITLSWTAATRTLADSGSGFLTAGFKEGTLIAVSGFTTSANNGLFTIESVAAGSIVVSETTMSNEAAGDTVTVMSDQIPLYKTTRGQMDEVYGSWQLMTGEPGYFLEEENNELVVIPTPTEANTLHCVVSRLPAQDMTNSGTTPVGLEIPDKYAIDMLDWACKLAYEMGDEETLNIPKAQYYEDQFTRKFGPRPSARAEKYRRMHPKETVMRPKRFGF